jgi:uncharacterized protein (DUF362 family)
MGCIGAKPLHTARFGEGTNDMSHGKHESPKGRIIDAPSLLAEFQARELSRRAMLKTAIAGSAALAGGTLVACGGPARGPLADAGSDGASDAGPDAVEDTEPPPPVTHLVGMGYDADYMTAFDAAMSETINLSFIEPGDTVYFKVNCNNGDLYPHSTNPALIVELANRCRDAGATRIIIGDRSFWGDRNTIGNMRANGVAGAADDVGAELLVFDDAAVEWVVLPQAEAPTWQGGFSLPVPVMESNHIINLPCVKTHFISHFTMALKNCLGLVNPVDRQRPGNLDVHAEPRLWYQIAEVNQHFTPSLNILDGHEALITGGPTVFDGAGPTYATPNVFIVSPDRIAADVMGIAVLQTLSPTSEEVTGAAAWRLPQIEQAVAHGLGITGPELLDVSGPTVPMLETYMTNARRTA